MTHDNDFVRLNFKNGETHNVFCKKIGLEWPPPKKLNINGTDFEQARISAISDEQISTMTHVARGAEYEEV